jgi:tetraacyldisaccharide 4'-kinase
MQPPGFWFSPRSDPGRIARALTPLSWIWTWAAERRLARAPSERLSIPVLCIGNLTLGGSGKTPMVMALVQRLAGKGITAHVVSRGHGGTLEGPVRVEEGVHRASDVGDEPLLISPFASVWVGRDRGAAGRAAERAGAQAVVMDDGFQNPALAKDVSIVVVDAATGFGNGRVVPSGPLRETVERGLARADLVMSVGAQDERAAFRLRWPEVAELPQLDAELRPLETGMDWKDLRVLAFAGIGRPEKFFATLRSLGANVVQTRTFDDHARYDSRILSRLEASALAERAQLVTTEKDAVRLPPDFRRNVLVLPVRLAVIDWRPLDELLARTGLTDRAEAAVDP